MIDVRIIGGDRVIAKITALPPRLMDELKEEVTRLTLELLRYVKERKLSGDPLRNRTGTLRRKINSRVEADGNGVVGTVGVKLAYAAAHEFGVDRQVTVRQHLRMVKMAWGRALKTPVQATVRAHSRHMRLPERSFLRSSLREMADEIRGRLERAVHRAVEKA